MGGGVSINNKQQTLFTLSAVELTVKHTFNDKADRWCLATPRFPGNRRVEQPAANLAVKSQLGLGNEVFRDIHSALWTWMCKYMSTEHIASSLIANN